MESLLEIVEPFEMACVDLSLMGQTGLGVPRNGIGSGCQHIVENMCVCDCGGERVRVRPTTPV